MKLMSRLDRAAKKPRPAGNTAAFLLLSFDGCLQPGLPMVNTIIEGRSRFRRLLYSLLD